MYSTLSNTPRPSGSSLAAGFANALVAAELTKAAICMALASAVLRDAALRAMMVELGFAIAGQGEQVAL